MGHRRENYHEDSPSQRKDSGPGSPNRSPTPDHIINLFPKENLVSEGVNRLGEPAVGKDQQNGPLSYVPPATDPPSPPVISRRKQLRQHYRNFTTSTGDELTPLTTTNLHSQANFQEEVISLHTMSASSDSHASGGERSGGGTESVQAKSRGRGNTTKMRSGWWRRLLGRKERATSRMIGLAENLESGQRRERDRFFPPNVIRNQKYSLYSFLPVILYNQFEYFYNFYFLAICITQLFPMLRVSYLFTNLAPLLLVLAVTIGKEAHDDYQRCLRDRESNGQLYRRLTATGLEDVPSAEIRVGDVIQVRKDQRIPADMVLLRTSEKSGSIFIRTDQLDGEIDWKMRLAIPGCQKLSSDYDIFTTGGVVYADRPHKDIYSFVGTFTHQTDEGEAVDPLNLEHTLWMNTVVATGTALGLVVYTGAETRAVLNTSRPSTKVGITDQEINRLSKALCLVVIALSVTMIALKGFYGIWWVHLIRLIVLFSHIIPISMRVNLDMGKTVYANEIMHDDKIEGVIVRTSTLSEELGRVQYLLTDKTGTLTKNDMELRRLHLGTICYGPESRDELARHLAVAFSRNTATAAAATGAPAATTTPNPAAPNQRARRDLTTRNYDTMLALALCHNVTPVQEENGSLSYQASSPDEVAIVKWCELVGLRLVARDRESITIQMGQHRLAFEILHIFPFTSETKRMGIVVRDTESGEVFFFEKGADAMMAPIVARNDWLDEECSNMAREGLRTLVVARKRLGAEALRTFETAYQRARVAVVDRNLQMQKVVEEHLEQDLELLAVTGVEDKLQDDVRNTLEKLGHAGVRIWMLTGDKVETATNIAISTRLFSRDRRILQYQRLASRADCEMVISAISKTRDCCLVIDGPSLQLIMAECPAQFMQVSLGLEAVACCRCTPTQKADVVRMIQQYSGKRVCCIGDGGNDVSMIQAADIGIGIVGKEGRQASLAADISILQFSHLLRLLVWHGRNSYKRTAKLSLFVIHRGFVITVMQAVFTAIFYFSPIALYQGLIAVGYTTVYTMAPVFSLVLDRDISEEVALTYVELYRDLTRGRELSYRVFFKWLMISVYQGGVIMMLAIWLFERDFIHIVSITFTALILNELLMVALEVCTWHYIMGVSEIASFLIYVASVRLLKDYFDVHFTTSLVFFWKVALITVISFLPLYLFYIVKHILAPSSATKLLSG